MIQLVSEEHDQLGRIVLLIALRRRLNIDCNDGLEIIIDNGRIAFRKV